MILLLQAVTIISFASASPAVQAANSTNESDLVYALARPHGEDSGGFNVGISSGEALRLRPLRLESKQDDGDQPTTGGQTPFFLPPSEKAATVVPVPNSAPPGVDPDPAHGPDPPSVRVGVQNDVDKKPSSVYDSWQHIRHANRDHWDPDQTTGWGPKAMASSALFYQWFAFFTALPMLGLLHHHLVGWATRTKRYFSAILVIVGVSSVFMLGVRIAINADMAMMWGTGFVLEILFSLENVFAFYVVIAAFKAPRRCAHKAVFTVVCFQIAFQMIFFMGLANLLRSFKLLPYLLGVWLVYGGVQCALDDDGENLDIQSTPLYKGLVWFLGKRIHPAFDRHMVVSKDGKFCITMLGLLTLSLMVTDFLLEIDVTLTKIEEMDNQWIAFTSSAFAAFTVPQFIFIAQELFTKYSLLKYAVSFTLVSFGAQMIAADIVDIPDVVSCGVVLCAVGLSIVFSPPSSLVESPTEPSSSDDGSPEDCSSPEVPAAIPAR